MGKKLELTGQVFGRLTVVSEVGRDAFGNVTWKCLCSCGREAVVNSGSLVTGHTKSCGCLSRDHAKDMGLVYGKLNITHGHQANRTKSSTYQSWAGMIARTQNPNADNYPRYGGRGISVSHEWESFENFLADMGERPEGKTLDRIDNYGNYEPGNCRWATPKEQQNNRRPVNTHGSC